MPVLLPGEEERPYPGLMNGTAGVAYFLLVYGKELKHPAATEAGIRALAQLQAEFKIKNGRVIKHTNIPYVLYYGTSGIALAFIKAYEILHDPAYKTFAEELLLVIPPHMLHNNLTTAFGITGIGEVYLEAYRVFGDQQWHDRADYIAASLIHMALDKTGSGKYWLTDNPYVATPDLMVGFSGVMHFLIRFMEPERFGFPMLTV